jgi:hypothetical protein
MLKKWFSFGLISWLFLLAGCNTGDNWQVDFTKPVQYAKGKESVIEIKVTEDNKPVTDLNASAEFEMSSMSHGNVNLKLEEEGDGIYRGKAELPMAGKYTVTFTLKKDGYTIEKIVEVEAKKVDSVAKINGDIISTEDLVFYRFINNTSPKKNTNSSSSRKSARWRLRSFNLGAASPRQ